MKKLFLIGENISASVSPAMHNASIEYLGLAADLVYELLPIAPDDFDSGIKKVLASPDVLGFNVTAPYKCRIIDYLDAVEPFVQKCGACNFVKKDNGRWFGGNTDGYGFVMPIVKKGLSVSSKKALIMGAGGAARAVALQLVNNGASAITLVNRDAAKAAALKDHICAYSGFAAEKFRIYSYIELQNDKFSSIMLGNDIIVNATSAGSGPNRLPVLFTPEMFNKNQIIYDLSYTAGSCDDLKRGSEKASAVYIDGREMLMYQGLVSFVQWTSKKPPVWLLRKAVDEALDKK